MTVWDTISRGEYVMIVLAAIFLAIIILWAVRRCAIAKLKKKNISLMHRVRDFVAERDVENAINLCEIKNFPGAKVAGKGLKMIGNPIQEIKWEMQDIISRQKFYLTKGITWMKGCAIIAPLAGICGTLAGICDGMIQISACGETADMAMLCGSISPTIVTSIAGFIVGAFAVIAVIDMDRAAGNAVEALAEIKDEIIDILNQPG